VEDDDLDLDLEPIKTPQKAAPKPAPAAKPAEAAKPAPTAKPADVARAKAAAALPARKPSPLTKACDALAGPFKALRLPACNARTAGLGLIGLLALVLLGGNWAPVRINLFGIWYIDPPKPLAFIVDVAIGACLVLLWQRSSARRAAEAKAAEAKTEPAPPAGTK
jgi:hypothetical protein